MAIYLTQGGGGAGQVDEIEGKLKSAIPDLKRVPSVEAIDPKSVNGAERSIVILAAAASEGANVDELIDVVRRYPRNLFFIVVGGDISAQDYKKLIQSGNADWVAEAGLPHEVLDIVGRVSAPAREMPRANRRSWFRSRRAREASAIPPSRSKPPCNS